MSLSEQMRLQKWAKDMVDCQNSGLTQQQWCDLHGIRIKTFEYRCRRVRAAAEEYMKEQRTESLPQQTKSFAAIPADTMKNAQDQSLGMPTNEDGTGANSVGSEVCGKCITGSPCAFWKLNNKV